MSLPIASRTRQQIRESIGDLLGGKMYLGKCTNTGSTTTARDSQIYGGVDDHKGKDIIFLTDATDLGKVRKTTAFDGTDQLTFSPAITNATAVDDEFEIWEDYSVAEVNRAINNAIVAATGNILMPINDTTLVKQKNEYEYNIPSNLMAIHSLDYVTDVKVDHSLETCDTVWDELVDGDVTASIDTSTYRQGSGSLKLVVAAGCAAGDILATEDITSIDITDADEIVLWVRSTVALSAGNIQVLLDNTAQCASPLESLDVTAVAANEMTPITISLSDPTALSAIISVGIKMVTDKGAFTLWIDDIRAQKANSRIYETLSPNMWEIIKAEDIGATQTAKIKLTEVGYSAIDNNSRIRLQGYQMAAVLSADASIPDIDPEYIIKYAAGHLLLSRAENARERQRASDLIALAEGAKHQASTSYAMNTRFVRR